MLHAFVLCLEAKLSVLGLSPSVADAYDDKTSTFTCAAPAGGYEVTFCPQGDSEGR